MLVKQSVLDREGFIVPRRSPEENLYSQLTSNLFNSGGSSSPFHNH